MSPHGIWRSSGWALVPLALFGGLVLGGWGPRRELERANAEIARLKARGPRGGDGASLNVITGVVGLPAAGERRTETPPASKETAPLPQTAAPATPAEPAENRPRISLAERLEEARAAWAVRVDIARNTFVARTGLRDEDLKRFDVVVAAMNLRLQAAFEQLAQAVAAGEEITPERALRIVHDLTGILTLTYDELDRQLPSTWRAAAGDDFDLTDFIDPSVAQPLVAVEPLLEDRPRFGPGRRRRDRPGAAVEIRRERGP